MQVLPDRNHIPFTPFTIRIDTRGEAMTLHYIIKTAYDIKNDQTMLDHEGNETAEFLMEKINELINPKT